MARKVGVKSVEKDKATLSDGTTLKTARNENLIDLYHHAVKDILLGDVDTGNPLYAFVKKGFQNMTKNIDSEVGSKTLDKIKSMAEETQEYLTKGEKADEDFIKWKLTNRLFPWQKLVFDCTSKRITLQCGRRSGKTFMEPFLAVLHCTKGFDIINGYQRKRSVLLMQLDMGNAESLFWENLIEASDISGMKYTANKGQHVVKFENGSFIELFGNHDARVREDLRGGDWSLVIIDEAQSQPALNYVCEDLLDSILTARDSTLILSGTGAITNKGYWKDITDGDKCDKWTHFHVTMKDNPSSPPNALEEVLVKNGWDKENVTYRREYLAENVIDTTRIVYPVFHKWDNIDGVINRIAIGIDYGVNGSNAFVALGLSSNGKIYELGVKKFNKADVTQIVNELVPFQNSLLEKYKVDKRNICCVADTSDQSISRELWRMKVNIYNAYKVERIQQIFDLREALRRGDVLVKDDILTDEMQSYVWKWDIDTKSVVYETDDDFFHPDALAALRYAFYYLIHKDRKYKNPLGAGNNE